MSEAEELDALIAMLSNLAITRGLDEAQLLKFAKSATAIHLDEGQSPLYTETRDDRFFVVVSGKVRATFVRGRKEPFTGIIREGDFFGAEKLLFGQTSLDSAVAIEPSNVDLDWHRSTGRNVTRNAPAAEKSQRRLQNIPPEA